MEGIPLKRKLCILLIFLCLVVAVLCWLGVGLYSSSAAVSDLKLELESIYGPEYIGKEVENGTEDMVFEVVPRTWFLTNWNLRNRLGLDYQYECRVIFTTDTGENTRNVRTVTYQAVDPMGADSITQRAYLVLDGN